ncbi:MAG: hypothetical protein J5833_03620 [Victivallales bacterium]|nr:hypothetical protein [Victivallales bacterium]
MKKIFTILICAFTAVFAEMTVPSFNGDSATPPEALPWDTLPWHGDFLELGKDTPAKVQTRFKIIRNGSELVLLVQADEPAMDTIVCKEYSNDSGLIWMNDTIELSFVHDAKVLSFYKIMADSSGTFADLSAVDDNTDRQAYNANGKWNSGCTVKATKKESSWELLVSVPLGSLGINDKTTAEWRLNVGRNRYAGGGTELSTWSSIPERNHMMPRFFRKVTLEGFSPLPYLVSAENIEWKFSRADAQEGKPFTFDLSFDFHNNTRSFRYLKAVAALTDESGVKSFSDKMLAMSADSYQKVKMSIPLAAQGKHSLALYFLTNNTRPQLAWRQDSDVVLEYSPLVLKVLEPSYRNNIYATMPNKRLTVKAELREPAAAEILISLSDDNKVLQSKRFDAKQTECVQTFDMASMPDGDYFVTATVGKLKQSAKIRKLPYQKGEVWLDEQNIVHIDGEIFLPYGWYGSTSVRPVPWENSTLLQTQFGSVANARSAISRCMAKGLRVICFPFNELDGKDWNPWKIFKDPDTRRKGLTKEQREKITEFITGVSDMDGILGWYMADEPEARDNNPLWYEEALELISSLDPYHPCLLLNYGIEGIKRYYTGCDILFPDCYPQYFEDGSTGHRLDCSSIWAQTATSLRPSWFMPLMTCWPALSNANLRGVPPSYFDQRSQFFQALIHNVKGFNMYAYFDSQFYSPLVFGPDAIGKTLQALKPLILQNSIAGAVEFKCDNKEFQAALKMDGKEACLIAVNPNRKATTATIRLKRDVGDTLYVAGENRQITVKGGEFTDSFDNNETHIYLTDKVLANSVPSVKETVDAIENHRRNRKKPGNIIGTGELFNIDYVNYGNKIDKGIFPIMSATSDSKFYTTKKTGSLPFLLDGITVPNLASMAWSPTSDDKAPAINIQLREPAVVSKVCIYTMNGNLTDVKVTTSNDDTALATGNTEDCIVLRLPPKTCKSLRFEFLKARVMSSQGYNERLVTEIEAYGEAE